MAMIPGSQARMFVLRGGGSPLGSAVIFRFRRINIRPRVPRIDATNSEGLPGDVRGDSWPVPNGILPPVPGPLPAAGLSGGAGVALPHPLGGFFPAFKNYPYESQLPGVGVCDVEVEQATWDTDQIPFQIPLPGGNNNIIMPGKYIQVVIRPNYWQTGKRFAYTFWSLYVEESPHRIDTKGDQPVSFTSYSNGPWTYPAVSGMNIIDPSDPGAFPMAELGMPIV